MFLTDWGRGFSSDPREHAMAMEVRTLSNIFVSRSLETLYELALLSYCADPVIEPPTPTSRRPHRPPSAT